MKIRAATLADGPRIQSLVFGVLREYGLEPDPAGTDTDLLDVEGFYQAGGGMFEVVEDESGRLLGTVGLWVRGDGSCELRKMYLAAEARGQGLGKQLLERAIAHARRAGCRRVDLETAGVLKEAIALYTRYGFKPVALPAHAACRCDAAYSLDLTASPPPGGG